jgi:hypothetical protein
LRQSEPSIRDERQDCKDRCDPSHLHWHKANSNLQVGIQGGPALTDAQMDRMKPEAGGQIALREERQQYEEIFNASIPLPEGTRNSSNPS